MREYCKCFPISLSYSNMWSNGSIFLKYSLTIFWRKILRIFECIYIYIYECVCEKLVCTDFCGSFTFVWNIFISFLVLVRFRKGKFSGKHFLVIFFKNFEIFLFYIHKKKTLCLMGIIFVFLLLTQIILQIMK